MKIRMAATAVMAVLLAACATPMVKTEVLQPGAPPVSALSFKAARHEFDGTGSGNTSLNAQWNPPMSHFGNVLVSTLSDSFPKRLAERGVKVVEAGPETPHLVLQPQTYRVMCSTGGCNATLVMGGVLLNGVEGTPRWRFESPLAYEGFNQKTLDAFEREVLDQLVKDGIIAASAAK